MADSLPQDSRRRGGSHERLIARLKNHPVGRLSKSKDESIRALGNFLENGRALRVEADYRIDRDFSHAKAKELILTAVRIAEVIAEIDKQ
ncbi:MAG: hypothetical protein O7E56_15425 [SAR324 cluster bacterium]|nr:hypothetical protein [SAR324 cluster bacterium]MCZ6629609.1 hypothetical protein [SAR324 cluster bacterium]MCZ6647613.1 hypothetical protein [SAR324 cluster bacterium]